MVRGKVDVVFSAEYMTIRSARVGDLSFTYDSIISVIHLSHPMPHKKQTLVIFRVNSPELPRVSEIVFQVGVIVCDCVCVCVCLCVCVCVCDCVCLCV